MKWPIRLILLLLFEHAAAPALAQQAVGGDAAAVATPPKNAAPAVPEIDAASPVAGAAGEPVEPVEPVGTAADTTVEPAALAVELNVGPADHCVNPPSDASPWGWTRDRLFDMVCGTAFWLDSSFGDDPFDGSERKIRGYFAVQTERREGAPFKTKPRFRVRMDLPNLNRRLNLTVERDDERQVLTGQTGETAPALESAVSARDDATTVSLGYEARRALDRLLDFRLGIRANQGKPNPYVRSRYRREYARDENSVWRFSQSLFYRHVEGFGETTLLDYEFILSRDWLLRWANSGTVSQVTQGMAWQTAGDLGHALSPTESLRFTLAWSGESAAPVRLGNYGYRLTYRKSLGRPWLVGEIYAGHDFRRSDPALARDIEAYGGASIEVHFGYNQ